ncbi:hypothetical protein [Nocardioides sp. CFH 31398]|uniref:PepSY domain-containing protein n=1 Tax=Nocardioides sp. CFH 31398 TaxID=2919579 RepID=UPI001F052634|nr:hypothetical protein [Nocardioides sp. CFH 31398]MCH1868368.1 hypothetical protein [Nocardioides sp. CFH 31398]
MNTTTAKHTLTRKRVWIPAVATVAVLGLGGAGVAYAADGDNGPLTGGDRDRVGAAALDAVGGGEVLEAETSDDRGEAYEVDVLDATGVEWSISLDDDLQVVTREREDADDDGDDRYDDTTDTSDTTDTPDADDRPVTGGERERVEAAAVEEVGSGEAVSVERSDDVRDGTPEAYEVEVVEADGTEWDVTLGEDLAVLDSRQDR